MVVHIDCNSYFASCEIADRPHLNDSPVVVASSNENNGGIILALNGVAKKLGLKRGNPMFQVAANQQPMAGESRGLTFTFHGATIYCFEVDHKKYHQISERIMQLVQEQDIVLNFVQYSVDEFFGEIPVENPDEMRHYVGMVKDLIEKETHIPVSCGCSLTYTLAKVATHYAKRYDGYQGICVLPAEKRRKALAQFPIEDVWGIGRKVYPKLQKMGYVSALAFADKRYDELAKAFNVTLLHTWQELNGVRAVHLEKRSSKQSIAHSRTLAHTSHDYKYLMSLLSSYVSIVAREMREQKSRCKQLTVFINTNRHREDLPQYENSITVQLPDYEDVTSELVRHAERAFKQIWRSGYEFKRLGVQLEKLISCQELASEKSLFEELEADPKKEKQRRLQHAVDAINQLFEGEVVRLGSYDTSDHKNMGLTKA